MLKKGILLSPIILLLRSGKQYLCKNLPLFYTNTHPLNFYCNFTTSWKPCQLRTCSVCQQSQSYGQYSFCLAGKSQKTKAHKSMEGHNILGRLLVSILKQQPYRNACYLAQEAFYHFRLVLFTYLSSVLLEIKVSRCIDKCVHSYNMQKVRDFSCKTVSPGVGALYPWNVVCVIQTVILHMVHWICNTINYYSR